MTRETILSRAEALFTERGIGDTSIADIAAAAGISKGTLFYHFRSKDDLVLAIAFAHIEKVSREMISYVEGGGEGAGPRELVERFFDRVLDATLRNRLHLYVVEEGMSRNARLREAMRGKYGEWEATMAKVLEPLLGDRAGTISRVLIALLDGLVIQAAVGRERPPIGAMLASILP